MTQESSIGDASCPSKRYVTSELFPIVYEELRRLASIHLRKEAPGHTLQATALVNEAYLRLRGANGQADFTNRNSFLAAAAEAMRHILVDAARRKLAAKRGGGNAREDLDVDQILAQEPSEVLAVHEALDALAQADPQCAELVKLHYFSGFSLEEAGEILGVSRATANRWWIYAKAFLKTALQDAR